MKQSVKTYYEEPLDTDFAAFQAVVESRRSVRKFSDEPIPDEVVEKCLDLALLAPTSSNLQCWEFYRVTDPVKKKALAEACMSQPAATTAPELIVCVARTDTWKKHTRQMLNFFESSEFEWPKTMKAYYQYGTRIGYGQGIFGELGVVKKAIGTLAGLARPMPRGPASHAEMVTWAVKTSALACENLMLAFRAAGYDTCPMEGMDEVRVKKICNLPARATVTMVISAGKRVPGGIYGPRIRFDRDQFIRTI